MPAPHDELDVVFDGRPTDEAIESLASLLLELEEQEQVSK